MKKLFKSPITWGIIAALLVAVPQITYYDFIATDQVHVGVLEGVVNYPGLSPFSLYRIADGKGEQVAKLVSDGPLPWYTNPNYKLYFCRHLPSLLITLTHKICGMNPTGYYIHNLLWYVLLVILVGLLVRRIVPDTGSSFAHPAAYLTVIFFAFSTIHLEVIFYSSARWTFVAAAFGLAGLLAHIKWREQNWKPGRLLSLIAFLLALFTGEAALAALAYLLAYELFGTGGPLKKKINALLPAAILVFIYLIFYAAMGYGAGGSDYYHNPLTDPITYFVNLPVKLAAILGDMFVGTLSLFWLDLTAPFQRLLIYGIAALTLIICGLLLYPVWKEAHAEQRRGIKWLIIGSIASMFPLASAFPGGRVVIIPFIGGSIVLAFIVHYWWKRLRKNLKSPLAWIGGLVCIGIFFLHCLLSSYFWFAGSRMLQAYLKGQKDFNKEKVLNEILPHQKAVFLSSDFESTLFFHYFYRKIHRLPMPASWWELSFSNHKHRYLRTAENKLELEITGEKVWEFFDGWGMRSRKPSLKKGDLIELSPELQVRILETERKVPTRMEFIFDHSLDDDRYRFFGIKDNRPYCLPPPPVGQSFKLKVNKPIKITDY